MSRTFVEVKTGLDEASQTSNFQNATLQSAGPKLAMSIATRLEVPAYVANAGEAAVAQFVQETLTRAAVAASGSKQLTFEVQIGHSSDWTPDPKLAS